MGAAEAGPPRRSTEGSSMRKLIVSSFVSLDGVIESPMTWISPFFDDESKEYAHKQLSDVEFFLRGRVTYDVFSARWPQIRGDKYFDRINGLKKLVASTTLKDVTWNASVIPCGAGNWAIPSRWILRESNPGSEN